MKKLTVLALLLALPAAVMAQTTTTTTKPAPATSVTGPQQVTEVTEELDPATGKVIRRTTRTTTVPAGTTAPAATSPTSEPVSSAANDAQVSNFFREKLKASTLTSSELLDVYNRFLDKVRNDRRRWQPADWSRAAAVLSSLNDRYDQLRTSFTLDDKLTIRGVQGEFQALRTAKQISTSVSDKL